MHQHAVDAEGHRNLGSEQHDVPGREGPQQKHRPGRRSELDAVAARHADLELGKDPQHHHEQNGRHGCSDGRRREGHAGARGRRVEDGDGHPDPGEAKPGGHRQLESRGRAEQPRDRRADGGVGRPGNATGDQAQQRREQQQRQIPEQAHELRLPRGGQGDEVERAFGAHEQAYHRVEKSDETDHPGRDLAGVVQILQQSPQDRVQRGVTFRHLCRHRHRGGRDRESSEGLEDPEGDDQQRHQREHRVVGQRRRLQPESMRPDPPDGHDRNTEDPVGEGR